MAASCRTASGFLYQAEIRTGYFNSEKGEFPNERRKCISACKAGTQRNLASGVQPLSVFFLLIALQVFLLVAVYLWVNAKLAAVFAVIQGAFMLCMIVYLFNIPMDSSAKLTWMLLISFAALPVTVLFFFTQSNLGHRKMKKAIEKSIEETKHLLSQPEGVLESLREDRDGTEDLVTYLNRTGCFPAYQDSEVTYYPSGEAKFEALLEDLKHAEKYIFLEYFIIEEGYMWGQILEILIAKAAEGVDVRVLYDGLGEMFQLPADYWKLLETKCIHSRAFGAIRPFVSSHYNYRDHRKILVIDGKTAYTGGVNLADEYINHIERFGHWKDTAIRIRGAAAKSFMLMFLQNWNVVTKGADWMPDLSGDTPKPDHPSGTVIPYCDSPLDADKTGESVYMDILYRATSYVHIMTPYLILDGELATALKYAGERGVDVKIILPGIPDKKLAYALAKSHYRELLKAGVKIYEYTPGFVHAKVFVSDDEKAVVGTINLDYRSLYHHFECAAYLYRTDCIPDIEQDFQQTLARCRQVTPESVKNEVLFYRFMGSILKFIAPLM